MGNLKKNIVENFREIKIIFKHFYKTFIEI